MECFLPSIAFDVSKSDEDEGCDSTRCVEGCDVTLGVGNICDVSTPVCNPGTIDKCRDYVYDSVVDVKDVCVKKDSSCCNEVVTDIVDSDVGGVCKSPCISSVNRLGRLKDEMNSFALDDSMSNVSICADGDLSVSVCEFESSEVLNVDSKSPVTFTPIKSARSSNKSVDLLNSINTRFDEPHLKISDDDAKNPILANSIVRTRGISKDADVRRSLKILGSSRCWTDRYENECSDESSVTESPVRSLGSMMSSQCDTSDSSFRRFCGYDVSPVGTPMRSCVSVNRLGDSVCRSDRFDRFLDIDILEMICLPLNPMCNVSLSKDEMCRCRLSGELEMLYKHFKNICTIIRRSSMRNDQPYFRVVQMLVQRMSRRSFSMDHLRQMLWLAPNLISVRWVLITESCRKRYSEYKDCSDTVFDISIRLQRFDGVGVSSTKDYENVCYRFKMILCCWRLKCGESVGKIKVPLADVPERCVRSNLSTPVRDVKSIGMGTPIREVNSVKMNRGLRGLTPMRVDKTPIRSLNRFDMSVDYTPCKSIRMLDPESTTRSSKRLRSFDSISPMSVDLLDTPGMRRIREKARRLDNDRKEYCERDGTLKFWIDMRWFTNMLLDIMVGDTPPVIRLEFLVDFIIKYGSRKVTQDQVTKWVNTLCEIDPGIMEKSVSKFEDYSTVLTINKSASLDKALDYINQKIKNFKSF